MTMGELAKATMTWRQAHFGAVLLGSLQLSHSSSDKNEIGEGAKCSSQRGDPVKVQKFWLDDVKDPVHTTQKVTILLFGTINVWANTSVKGHCKCRFMFSWNWCLVPSCQQQWYPQLPMKNYILVPQGYQSACTTWVPVPWKYPQKPWLDRLFLPTKYHWWSTWPGLLKETNNQASKVWVLEALNLQGLIECPESKQKQARELLLKWEHLFAHSDLHLAKTALIKHKIQLTDQTPFKDHYWHIPPHMYDNMRVHIQEMLDISAIHKSHSPWASTVVLVQKKDGGLRVLYWPQETQ